MASMICERETIVFVGALAIKTGDQYFLRTVASRTLIALRIAARSAVIFAWMEAMSGDVVWATPCWTDNERARAGHPAGHFHVGSPLKKETFDCEAMPHRVSGKTQNK